MTPAEETLLRSFDVSRETHEKLKAYEALVRKWSRRINLVSPSTIEHLWARHFLDSAQLLNHAPSEVTSWADFGSGGGFPGLVISILRPDIRVTLVESDQRKAVFLRTVIRETGANASVEAQRVEDLPPLNADVVSARALASLDTLLAFALQHMKPGGTALFPRGATYQEDLQSALETFRFHCETDPSLSSSDSRILKITEIERV